MTATESVDGSPGVLAEAEDNRHIEDNRTVTVMNDRGLGETPRLVSVRASQGYGLARIEPRFPGIASQHRQIAQHSVPWGPDGLAVCGDKKPAHEKLTERKKKR